MDLIRFPVRVSKSIVESEMGDAGHVKNTCFVRYFECARVQYLQRIGLNELMTETGIGVIVAQTICKYLKPLVYPDLISVGAKVKSTGKSSFVLEYSIVSQKNGLSATGEEVIVIYDYNNAKKTNLPLVIKEAIERIEIGESYRGNCIKHIPHGVCSTEISFCLIDGILKDVKFVKGCTGNAQGISRLVEGMNAIDVMRRLKGIKCQNGTSCPDQLAIAIENSLDCTKSSLEG